MRKLLAAIFVFTLLPGVAVAGGGGNLSACPGFAAGTTVSLLDSCFSGVAHFAPAGTTIIISNDGELPHTFTAVDGSFDTGQLRPGETYELTVSEPGVIQVFCTLHGTAEGAGMAGVLLVGEAEPPAVASSIDVTAIKEAVAYEIAYGSQSLVTAIESQARVIEALAEEQERLAVSLDELAQSEDAAVTPQAPVAALPEEPGDQPVWLLMLAGVSIGLASAALFLVRRVGRRQGGVTTA